MNFATYINQIFLENQSKKMLYFFLLLSNQMLKSSLNYDAQLQFKAIYIDKKCEI